MPYITTRVDRGNRDSASSWRHRSPHRNSRAPVAGDTVGVPRGHRGREPRVLTSNGMPGHIAGDFPNNHDPIPAPAARAPISSYRCGRRSPQCRPYLKMWIFGVAVNGVVFDLLRDRSGNRDGASGWQFEVLAPAVAVCWASTSTTATPRAAAVCIITTACRPASSGDSAEQAAERPMHLLGYAADGFPIYGPEGPPTRLRSTAPRAGIARAIISSRAARRRPGGRHDGTFVEDFVYEGGSGDLDECNGRTGVTPGSPAGPIIMCSPTSSRSSPCAYRGAPDASFKHGPPPGVCRPSHRSSMRYRGVS